MDLTLVALAIGFLASVAQAVTGFGFGLVLVPLFSLVYDPKAVVLISLTLGFLTKPPLLWLDRRFVQWRVIAPLAIASLLGNAVGTRALVYASGPTLRLAVGVVVVVLSTLLLLEFRLTIRHERLATWLVGLVSGTLTGATGMGGPPVVLFGVNQRWAKQSIRANMQALSLLTFGFSAGLIVLSGGLTPEVAALEAIMLPAVAAGLVLGNFVFGKLPREPMYRLINLFVIATGLVGAWSGLTTLLQG